MSMNAAFRPGDVHRRVAALGCGGHDLAAQPVDELLRLQVLRRRVGCHEDDRDRLLVVELRLAGGRDAVEVPHAVVDALRRLGVPVHVDDDRDRAVEAGRRSRRRGGRTRAARSARWAACPGRRRRGEQAPTWPRARPRPAAARRTRACGSSSRTGPSERSASARAPPRSRRSAGGGTLAGRSPVPVAWPRTRPNSGSSRPGPSRTRRSPGMTRRPNGKSQRPVQPVIRVSSPLFRYILPISDGMTNALTG